MRILIIGPPNTGKQALASAIKDRNPHLAITHPPELPYDLAYGSLSDYRTELNLATSRAFMMVKEDHAIFTHSPLSSMAHISARVFSRIETTNDFDPNDEWTLTLLTAGQILKDSLKYDVAILIDLVTYEDYFDECLADAYQALVKDLGIKPKILLRYPFEGEEDILEQIQFFIDEATYQRADSQESSQQD